MPTSAPDPVTFRQIVVTEDADGDGMGDLFALDADGFWAFSGYTGSSFASYRKMATGWAARDLVGVRDTSSATRLATCCSGTTPTPTGPLHYARASPAPTE